MFITLLQKKLNEKLIEVCVFIDLNADSLRVDNFLSIFFFIDYQQLLIYLPIKEHIVIN